MVEGVVFDCADPAKLAAFWAAVTGGIADVREPAWATVTDDPTVDATSVRSGPGVTLAFQRVPEPKATKNRLHLDLGVADLASETRRLVDLGARTVGDVVTDDQGRFQVLTDPEGNEFCLVTDLPA